MKSDMNKKRLAICAIYDKYGIIDESILYLLREMRAISTHLLAVCNGVIEEKSVKILRSYVDKVYLRDNSGFDVEAYKYVLENCLGWDIVHEYDELILFNTTFFGPFCSMQTIFDAMDFKALDFWGLTEHGAMRVGECQIYTHVQSYFLVITSRLLHSEDFSIFWESRKKDWMISTRLSMILNYH